MTTTRVALALALAAIGTAPLHAQQRQRMNHPEMAQESGRQGGMMMARIQAFAPSALLERREALELTDDQIRQLTGVADAAKAASDEAMATHERHRQAVHAALMQDAPNEDSVLTHMAAAHAAMGLAHQTELRASLRAMGILTAEQRAAVPAASPMGGQSMHGNGPRMRGYAMGAGQQQGCCNR